jgi:hypothetical protein
MNPTDRILKVDVVGRVWTPGEQREAVLDEFPLVPKVSAALWERMRGGETPFRWQAGEHGGQLSRSACADGRRSLAGIYVPKALR